MNELEKATEFAKKQNIRFDSITYECEWKDFKVYAPSFNVEGDYFIGLPEYILIDRLENVRRANTDEIYKILESLPE